MKRAHVACAAVALFGHLACSDPQSSGVNGDTNTGLSSVGTGLVPTVPRASSCGPAAVPGSMELWRTSVGQDDALQPTSVGTDEDGNAFVARAAGETLKLSDSGGVLWSRAFGSLVATDAAKNVVVAGIFSGTLSLGTRSILASGGSDVYVAKLDTDGNVLYGVALGGAGDENVSSLAVDGDGNAIVSGNGLGTVKLDAAGHVMWTKDFSGVVAVDSTGSVVLTGALSGTVNFGGEPLTSAGGQDVFVAKLDSAGNHLFSRRFGDSGVAQRGEAIAVDPADNVLVSGVVDGAVDFGGGALVIPKGTCPAETWCETAGFIVKLDPSLQYTWSRSEAPVRSMEGVASDSHGNVVVSGAYPGDAPPYRTLLLVEFDADGKDIGIGARLDPSLVAAGVGHQIAVDRCDRMLWSLSIPPSLGTDASSNSFLSKLDK